MRFRTWNICGMESDVKISGVTQMVRLHRIEVLLIQEVKKIVLEDKLVRRIWRDDDFEFMFSAAVGLFGWLLSVWDKNSFQVVDSVIHRHNILLEGYCIADKLNCVIRIVYAPCNLQIQIELWGELWEVKVNRLKIWIVGGDFNVVRPRSERIGCSSSEREEVHMVWSKREKKQVGQILLDNEIVVASYGGFKKSLAGTRNNTAALYWNLHKLKGVLKKWNIEQCENFNSEVRSLENKIGILKDFGSFDIDRQAELSQLKIKAVGIFTWSVGYVLVKWLVNSFQRPWGVARSLVEIVTLACDCIFVLFKFVASSEAVLLNTPKAAPKPPAAGDGLECKEDNIKH
ncbi:hypothetical protein GQ457_11G030440 [Hibiscus cannabinus]